MRILRSGAAAGVLGATVALTSATTAAAAGDANASCVGIIVSTLAPTRTLDVDDFKALADELEAPNFGLFVASGAQLHLGSFENCLPPT